MHNLTLKYKFANSFYNSIMEHCELITSELIRLIKNILIIDLNNKIEIAFFDRDWRLGKTYKIFNVYPPFLRSFMCHHD